MTAVFPVDADLQLAAVGVVAFLVLWLIYEVPLLLLGAALGAALCGTSQLLIVLAVVVCYATVLAVVTAQTITDYANCYRTLCKFPFGRLFFDRVMVALVVRRCFVRRRLFWRMLVANHSIGTRESYFSMHNSAI